MICDIFNDDIIYNLPENCGENFLHRYEKTKLYEGYLMLNIPKNSAFLDVGAHNGDTVLTLALYAKNNNRDDIRFVAFEPDEVKSNFIKVAADANDLNIKIYLLAVGEKDRYVSRNADMPLHSGAVAYSEKSQNDDVRMINLDSLFDELGEVGFLHLDVEGWEAKVLEGSNNILTNYRPIIVAEYWKERHSNNRGFSRTPIRDISQVLDKYDKKYVKFDDIRDKENNVVYLPEGMSISKLSKDF